MSFDAAALPFAKLMGVAFTEAAKERVVGRLLVRDDLCTAGGILHGGAVMAFADSLARSVRSSTWRPGSTPRRSRARPTSSAPPRPGRR